MQQGIAQFLDAPQAINPGEDKRRTIAACAIVAAVAFAFCFTQEQDYDAFWHLASGEWMIEHTRVLDHDPFTSMPDQPGTEWVNVYWLFQLIITAVHAAGGFVALTVFKALLCVAGATLMTRSLVRKAPAGWVVVCMTITIIILADRVRVRPEMFTLPMIMITVALLEDVRGGLSTRRLWWLVPMMTAWVNMHGLFFLGLVLAYLAVLGSGVDKLMGRGRLSSRLWSLNIVAWLLAATAACLISPWPIEAFLHPLTLATRIDGTGDYYVYGVSELQRTWTTLGQYPLACGVTLLAAVSMLLNTRKVPIGHWLWLVAMTTIALLARRNVGLCIAPIGYLLAVHGGECVMQTGNRLHQWRGLKIASHIANAMAVLMAAVLIVLCVTENYHLMKNSSRRFAAGININNYPVGIASYLGQLKAQGDVLPLSFGDGSTYIYYSYPTRKVWMDGRLEIHSTERFRMLHEARNELIAAGALRHDSLVAKPPRSVRFITVRNDMHQALTVLMHSERHRLIRLDNAGACFAYLGWRGDDEHLLPAQPNIDDFDLPLGPEGIMGMPAQTRRWYRANPQCPYRGPAGMLMALGKMDRKSISWRTTDRDLQRKCAALSARYYEAALRAGLTQDDLVKPMLAKAWAQLGDWISHDDFKHAINPATARAVFLVHDTDMSQVDPQQVWTVGLMRVETLIRANQLESALEQIEAMRNFLPGKQRVTPRTEYVKMHASLRDSIAIQRSRSIESLDNVTDPLERARTYITLGLTSSAIRELRNAPDTPENVLALARTLMLSGRTSEARHLLAAMGESPEGKICLALCEMIEGRHEQTIRMLAKLPEGADHVMMLKQITGFQSLD